jgi:hypothetical protein
MGASLPGNLHPIDDGNRMVQFRAVVLKPALDGEPPRRHASVRGADKLHVLGHEREQVVPPLMHDLLPAIRHVARHRLLRRDLARVHRVLHQRGPDEHGRFPVRVRERGRARAVDVREGWGPGGAQGDAVARGRRCRWWCLLLVRLLVRGRGRDRGRGRGRVTWGWLVVAIRERRLRIP